MLKIRLMRIGAKKKPFYRVVVVDERAKRTGTYIELLGTYNPLTEPKEINLKKDRIDYWTKQGAQPSEGYLRIIGKAPQRPPRKPKKEKPAKKTETPKESEAKEAATKPEDQVVGESEKSQESEAQTTDKPPQPDMPEPKTTDTQAPSETPTSSEKSEDSSDA